MHARSEPLFSVPIRDLERSDQRRTWEIPPAWLDWALSDSEARSDGSPGTLELYLKKTGREILVKGRARAAVHMPCARTLEPVAVALDAEILLFLSPRPTVAPSAARGSSAGPAKHSRDGKRQRGTQSGALREPGGESAAASPGASPAPGGASVRGGPPSRRGALRTGPAWAADDSDDGSSELLSSEEAARDEYSGDAVELDAFVREHLLLELPLFPVRSDLPFEPNAATNTPPDDSGAAPDPRLAPLAELASQLKKTGKLPK